MNAENQTARAYTQGQAEDETGWIHAVLEGVFALKDITTGLQKGKTILKVKAVIFVFAVNPRQSAAHI